MDKVFVLSTFCWLDWKHLNWEVELQVLQELLDSELFDALEEALPGEVTGVLQGYVMRWIL